MLDVRPEPIALPRLVEELTRTFQPIAGQKRIGLEIRLADGAPGTIETDPTRLSQVLKNLMSNALKFTERGEVELDDHRRRGRGPRSRCATPASGSPATSTSMIFEAFRQADGASNRKFGGTGLGLSISRDLARLLGGDLRVESAPGQGSTFTLTLPARRSSQVAQARPAALRPRAAGPAPQGARQADRQPRARAVPR